MVYSLRKKTDGTQAVYVSFPYQIEDGRIFLDVPGGNIEAGDEIPGSSNDSVDRGEFCGGRSSDVQVVMGSPEIPLNAVRCHQYRTLSGRSRSPDHQYVFLADE